MSNNNNNMIDNLENVSSEFCFDIWNLCQTLMKEREEFLGQMRNTIKNHEKMIKSHVDFIKQISEYKNKYEQFMRVQLNQEETENEVNNQDANENNNDEDDLRLIIQEDDNSTIAPISEIHEITNAQPSKSNGTKLNKEQLDKSNTSEETNLDGNESFKRPQRIVYNNYKIPSNIQLKECKIKIKRLQNDEILRHKVSRN
jgi:hypothetical protein